MLEDSLSKPFKCGRLRWPGPSAKSLAFPGKSAPPEPDKRLEYQGLTTMRQMQDLKAEARNGTGKGPSYQTRQKGLIPAVLYGGKSEPENVSVERHALERQVETGNFLTTLYMLDVGGKKQR